MGQLFVLYLTEEVARMQGDTQPVTPGSWIHGLVTSHNYCVLTSTEVQAGRHGWVVAGWMDGVEHKSGEDRPGRERPD